ncbi:hypothetical protein GLE_2842 [Lysobacter enzymogenes]|uniref:Uncharacterized protein n=1 Tax=Lysobacter enzymogenes TaxID=69 RepID=A0A0S2DI76_LYSEN|nr:hypothetical protein [Lysobacter enzymogenes]ALN58190.1 hypothetical protein GLE_2842 [Lysobacter enzymogenes]QCW26635.1 hypothetical protein FE772_14190 [Lysobacter enzymogenes]
MKYALAFAAVLFVAPACATSIVPKPLEELVRESDHVVVATVVGVDMVDGRGRALNDPAARTGPGSANRMSFELKVESVLFTRAGSLPPRIRVPLWSMWHYQLGTMRDEVVGSRGIFLLKGAPPKGDRYEPAYPGGFQRPLEEREQIERLLPR